MITPGRQHAHVVVSASVPDARVCDREADAPQSAAFIARLSEVFIAGVSRAYRGLSRRGRTGSRRRARDRSRGWRLVDREIGDWWIAPRALFFLPLFDRSASALMVALHRALRACASFSVTLAVRACVSLVVLRARALFRSV